ncbi:MAG: hypothetical protein HY376_03580 [Candidatus Blackburnbacteria bacterium]|nr:hypothetical protein [Candidatus Blackburnbacteria bacterium]
MPLTLTRTDAQKGVMGNLRWEALDVAFDASYDNTGVRATSGETGISAANLGLVFLALVLAEQRAGYAFDFDYTNNRLHAYRVAGVAALAHAGGAVDTHAAAGVTQPDAHAQHQHAVTTVMAAGGGSALTEPMVAGAFETAGAGQTNTGAVDAGGPTTHASAAVGAHAFTQANNHAAIAEAAMAEVANETDLSTALASVRVFVLGR